MVFFVSFGSHPGSLRFCVATKGIKAKAMIFTVIGLCASILFANALAETSLSYCEQRNRGFEDRASMIQRYRSHMSSLTPSGNENPNGCNSNTTNCPNVCESACTFNQLNDTSCWNLGECGVTLQTCKFEGGNISATSCITAPVNCSITWYCWRVASRRECGPVSPPQHKVCLNGTEGTRWSCLLRAESLAACRVQNRRLRACWSRKAVHMVRCPTPCVC